MTSILAITLVYSTFVILIWGSPQSDSPWCHKHRTMLNITATIVVTVTFVVVFWKDLALMPEFQVSVQ